MNSKVLFFMIICLSIGLSLCWNIGYSATMKCTVSGNTITCNDTSSDVISVDTTKILKTVSYPYIQVFGTEYAVGENMTVWLQLLNSNKTPITNATCFDKVWYPDKTALNGYKSMIYLDEGIHYYDLVAESRYGVYPLSAKCYIPEIKDFSKRYLKDDGSPSFELSLTANWVYAQNYTWTNPTPSNVDMCAFMRVSGSPVAYWTLNRTNIQQITGMPIVAGWVCNSISNLSLFNFTGNNYFGINCTNCGGGTRVYLQYDNGNTSFLYNTSWYSVPYTYFIRLNVTDISSINETEYQVVMSSGEIHVSEPLSSMDDIMDYIVAYGSMDLKSNHDTCQDNTTLIHQLTYENCIGSNCFTYQRNETEVCARGCYEEATGEAYCIPSEFNVLFIILVFIAIIVILVAVTLIKGWY